MATTADQVADLEQRVKALEASKTELGTAFNLASSVLKYSGVTIASALVAAGGVATSLAIFWVQLANNEKAIAELKADSKLATKNVADRLQSWEDKSFKRPTIQALFQPADFISLKEDHLTIAVTKDGKTLRRVFQVEPGITVEKDGKRVELAKLNLPPGTPIRFMVGDDPHELMAVELSHKK